MNKFTAGVIAGGLVGAVGLSYVLSDRRTRRRVVKDSKRFANKCSHAFDNVSHMF